MEYLVNAFINILSDLILNFVYYSFKIKIANNNSIMKSNIRIIDLFHCLGGHYIDTGPVNGWSR